MDFDLRWLIAALLGLAIGASARFFAFPVPAPPKLAGALLVVAMTLGYVITDNYMSKKEKTEQKSTSDNASESSASAQDG